MTKVTYLPEELGKEVEAPSGYYLPLEEVFARYEGKNLLYIAGSGCIEASCCGISGWNYVRVEGFVGDDARARYEEAAQGHGDRAALEVETVSDGQARDGIRRQLSAKYPSARIEFR